MISINRLRFSINRLRYVIIVLLAVGLGVVVPQAARLAESATLLVVAFLLYSSLRGTAFTPGDVPRFLLPTTAVLAITYLAIPIVGINWARYLLSGDSLLGVAVVLSAPATAGSAIVWTRLGDGNDELSGLTAIVSIALAPLLTPVVLVGLIGHLHALSVVGLAAELTLVISLAVALRWIVPDDAVTERMIEYGTVGAIVLLIYGVVGTAGLAGTSVGLVGRVGSLVVVVFLVGVLAVFSFRVATDRGRPDLLAVLFSGTLKNLGISLFVVLSFDSVVAVHAVIVYYVGQQLLSALVVDGLGEDAPALAMTER